MTDAIRRAAEKVIEELPAACEHKASGMGLCDSCTADLLEKHIRPLVEALRHCEQHCPCGARPESINSHHHVIGCPVELALITYADPDKEKRI